MSGEGHPVPASPNAPRAPIALGNLAADAALWCVLVLAMQAFRGVLLWLFRAELAPGSGAAQFFRCFGTGLRFDISIATYAVLPTLALTLVSFFRPVSAAHRRVRRALAGTLAAVSLLTFAIDVAYFREYHDQFNHWIFGLVFDDRTAIAKTVWKSYPVVWLLLGVSFLVWGVMFAGRACWRAVSERVALPAWPALGAARFVTPVVILLLAVFGLRASFGSRPVQMKDAAVTTDPFLNKLVMNPFAALTYAIKHHRMLSASKGLRVILPDGDVRAAARAWFPQVAAVTNLDDCLKRTAAGSSVRPPQHIILVVEESYDAWGLRPECAALHANERLAALTRVGIAADAFVSAADGTMPSLAALITGLPDTGVHVNYQPAAKQPFPTSAAPIFKRLGYRTRFFYGGYLSWQRLGDFCREQGFDEVQGGPQMSERLTGNEWGVDDEATFNAVLNRLGDEPSFNMIMTTSYHPPYSVDLKGEGFPQEKLQPELDARGFTARETRILGHLWYADAALGEFVEAGLKAHPRILFAITGDHWSRRAFSSRPILFGQRAVPFVLYGPEVLRNVPRPPRIAGSHTDILPTLVELSAPAGFEYHAFGRNLLDATQTQIGFGNHAVVTPDFILEVGPQGAVQDMQGKPAHDRVPVEEWRQRYRQLHALSWWRVMKGSAL